jgi:hypothetical protein
MAEQQGCVFALPAGSDDVESPGRNGWSGDSRSSLRSASASRPMMASANRAPGSVTTVCFRIRLVDHEHPRSHVDSAAPPGSRCRFQDVRHAQAISFDAGVAERLAARRDGGEGDPGDALYAERSRWPLVRPATDHFEFDALDLLAVAVDIARLDGGDGELRDCAIARVGVRRRFARFGVLHPLVALSGFLVVVVAGWLTLIDVCVESLEPEVP